MVRNLSVFLILVLFSKNILAAAPEVQRQWRPKMILAGDSWAALPCLFKSAELAFLHKKINIHIENCLQTSEIGARANSWMQKKTFRKTLEILQKDAQRARPEIAVIYLSLGGNDFLSQWDKFMSPEEEGAVIAQIRANVAEIIRNFHTINPKVKILVSGYDFGFQMAGSKISAYRNADEAMGHPSALELQTGMEHLAQGMADLAQLPNVDFIHHFGLMHYYFGVPSLGIPKKTTMPPWQISSPANPGAFGGALGSHNHWRAMLRVGKLLVDSIHLSPRGFRYTFEHSADAYLRDWVNEATRHAP